MLPACGYIETWSEYFRKTKWKYEYTKQIMNEERIAGQHWGWASQMFWIHKEINENHAKEESGIQTWKMKTSV